MSHLVPLCKGGLEPIIGHLKSDFRLARNYLKGYLVDYYKKVEDKIQVEEYLIAQLNLRKNYIKNDNKLYKVE